MATVEIKQWRTSMGLSQAQLAERMGVDQSYVSSYETGRRSPGVDVLQRIADGLGGHLTIGIELDGSVDDRLDDALTIAALAAELTATDHLATRRRLVLEFVRGHTDADIATRHALYRRRPELIGGAWDALLGGLAEHLAFHDSRDAPPWVYEPERFLSQAWYFVDEPRLRSYARASSPAACSRRLVFIDRADLGRV